MTTTDPQDEQLTQVDNNNKVIGPISRGLAHTTPGIFYRTIYVLVKNKNGEVLIQKRSATKDLYPNCWDISVGGHVNFGKSYIETAIKELKEELGLKVKGNDLVLKGNVLVKLPKSSEFFEVYEYKLKFGETPNPSTEEVSNIKWMTIKDIKQSMVHKTLSWYARPEQIVATLF